MVRITRAGRLAITIAVVVALFVAVAIGTSLARPEALEQSASVSGDVPGSVAGWNRDQLVNAAIIMQAGDDLGFDERDRVIAVMTAMGESSLRVLDYGDTAGPDSRGLFQQRDSWGPFGVRMDAYQSAVLFYNALGDVDNRGEMAPTYVAHTVQINRDPLHYEAFWDDAATVVQALEAADIAVQVD